MKSLAVSTLVLLFAATSLRADSLDQDFATPPPVARPYVWWHWMSSDVSALGIDKDLDAMKQMGVPGVTVCPVGSTTGINHTVLGNSPWPNVTYLSPAWWALLQHAVDRAGQLGIEVGMHNCAGWSASGGPWITPELSMQKLVWSQTSVTGPKEFSGALDQPEVDRKFNFYRDVAVVAVPVSDAIHITDCQDISSKMTADGTLTWSVPAGKWTIFRIGHTTTGKTPHPMPDGFDGLECDKLSASAARIHLQNVLDQVHQYLPQPQYKAFAHILFDSYEAGPQNWTDGFRQEFINRRGYDPIPWIPSMAGEKIGGDLAKRFQWDMNQTITELFVQNNFGVFHKMLEDEHLRMCFEPYKGPFDTISATAECDTPMGEFWPQGKGILRAVPAAAQALGEKITGAESFTSSPVVSQWTETPATLKPVADAAICAGINQFYLHEWTLQPFDDNIKPGMTAGWWGTHFGRNQTWFTQGRGWFDYLARCAAVLQHGQVVSDFCTLEFAMDSGDALSFKLFAGCTAENHQIVTPTGRRYALLVLPQDSTLMLPEVAAKVKSLVADGAVVLGPKPTASPSLRDYPNCDSQVSSIANEVWGDTTSASNEHDFGQGKVFWKQPVADVLAATGIAPDFQMPDVQDTKIQFIHRRDGDSDIYFVANLATHSVNFPASFRVTGKTPEFWHPAEGTTEIAGLWKESAGRTEIPLSLGPTESIFVIFRNSDASSDHAVACDDSTGSLFVNSAKELHLESSTPGSHQLQFSSGRSQSVIVPTLPAALTLAGKWNVHFPPHWGAPDSITLDALKPLSESSDPGVKYFSGSAVYSQDFQLSADFINQNQRIILDLGQLADMANVSLNGHDYPVLLYPPFAVDVTDAIKPGPNHLEITITNTWHNRLIGDEQQPADIEWGEPAIYNHKNPEGRPLRAFPDWLVAGKPRPTSSRYTFTTWNYFDRNSPLEKSGLLGPVVLRVEADLVIPDH